MIRTRIPDGRWQARGLLVLAASAALLAACEPRTEDLRAPAAAAEEGTAPGERAPTLVGEADPGAPWTLVPADSEYTAIVFIRSADCGLCRLRLEEIARHEAAYDAAGVTVVVASPDAPDRLRDAVREAGAGISSVSVDPEVLRRWEVADGAGPVLPATYLLDRDGIVRYRHVGRNAGDRANDVEVLASVGQDRERRAVRR